jgi:predicted ATPase/DNA-binding winged helix-turn-helix (wHTH) protein
MSGQIFRFGPFELHREQRRLYRDAKLIQLGSRAFDILYLLAARAGEVVSNEELISTVWPNVFVAENNLRVNMTALRKALGPEGSATDGYISNVPGRGYSFTVAVTCETVGPPAPRLQDGPSVMRSLPRPLGTVFGREAALDILTAQLSQRRLVTITGAGGIGKTTLVLAAAEQLKEIYPDGIAFVDLAPTSDPVMVPRAIASALGHAFRDDSIVPDLIDALGNRRFLIVLDSCEHLVTAVALLSEQLLQGTAHLGILATSRELLRADGEWVLPLEALELPPATGTVSASAAQQSPAVQLFVDRANASGSRFVLDDASAPHVVDICCQLDGIALAIELAASRTDTLGVKSLAASLGDRFRLLSRGRRTAVPRHQTLRATLDWSYQLLTASEQRVLSRLSPLVGRFTARAALAVAGDIALSDFAIEEAIANLVAKSLISVDATYDHTIFRLADTTRAYSFEKLRESGELLKVQSAHAKFFADAFARAEQDIERLSSSEWLDLYGWQLDDLRGALDWAFSPEGDQDVGITLTALAIPLWHQLSLVDECLHRVALALGVIPKGTPDKRRMQLQAALGWPQMQAVSGLPSGAEAWKATLTLAEELGDVDYQLRSLWALWVDRTNHAEPTQAMILASRFAELTTRSGNRDDDAVADRMRGATLHLLGQQDEARDTLKGMLARYGAQPHRNHIIRFQYDQRLLAEVALTRVLWLQGNSAEAISLLDTLIDQAKLRNHGPTYANILAEAACPIALMACDFDRAEHFIALLRTETRAQSMDVWRTYADAFEGEMLIRRGEARAGLDVLAGALAILRESGFVLYDMAFRGIISVGMEAAGSNGDAAMELDLALAQCERTGEGWYLPELQRIRAEHLFSEGETASGTALLARASDLAHRQGAGFWKAQLDRSIKRHSCG